MLPVPRPEMTVAMCAYLEINSYNADTELMDFKNELRKQLNFIITSCRAYDEGLREEGIRIAMVARVLFHQTRQSNALVLTHLNASRLKLRSTCDDLAKSEPHFLGFIGLEPSTGQFRPYLDQVVRDQAIDFDIWWQHEPIMKLLNHPDETITRRQLILAAANRDGGAHVDPTKPSEYERLASGIGLRADVKFATGLRKVVELQYANLAALRQIGHEILTSPELVALTQ
jgi:hypothetical protein